MHALYPLLAMCVVSLGRRHRLLLPWLFAISVLLDDSPRGGHKLEAKGRGQGRHSSGERVTELRGPCQSSGGCEAEATNSLGLQWLPRHNLSPGLRVYGGCDSEDEGDVGGAPTRYADSFVQKGRVKEHRGSRSDL